MAFHLALAANSEGAHCGPRCFSPKQEQHVSVGHNDLTGRLKLGLYVGHYLVSSTGDAG